MAKNQTPEMRGFFVFNGVKLPERREFDNSHGCMLLITKSKFIATKGNLSGRNTAAFITT